MSEIKVNKISPKQTCTQLTLGDSGDTIIIPAGATITNNGTATGFGRTGTVDWDTTKKTSGFTAVSGVGYFCDTTLGAFTVTLPSSPSAGAIVAISDYANTFATNNITVGRNGSNIGGTATNAVLLTNGIAVTFVYVDATQGWIVTDSGNRSDLPTPAYIVATGGTISTIGDYKIHSFTGPGTFTVCSVGNPVGSNSVDYLVVAGGGAAGGNGGGGGGAGGFRSSTSLPVSATAYPVTVGAGGNITPGSGKGLSGSPSIFSTITSTGGGGGGGNASPFATDIPGAPGGSGGGGSAQNPVGAPGTAGSGNTPPVSPPQGNPGGTGWTPYGYPYSGGGGGGASASGTIAPGGGTGGPGGAGSPITSIFGSSPQPFYGPTNGVYAGGGGGSPGDGSGGAAPGGTGGGGAGQQTSGIAGTTNTGGGGGGGGGSAPTAGANGGSGIVLIRYKFQ